MEQKHKNSSPPGGLEPPTSRLTAGRASHCATEDREEWGKLQLLWIEHSTSRYRTECFDLKWTSVWRSPM